MSLHLKNADNKEIEKKEKFSITVLALINNLCFLSFLFLFMHIWIDR